MIIVSVCVCMCVCVRVCVCIRACMCMCTVCEACMHNINLTNQYNIFQWRYSYQRYSYSCSSLHLTVIVVVLPSRPVARLTVVRNGGLFQEVIVPYEVEISGRSDLAPSTGRITFSPRQNETVSS